MRYGLADVGIDARRDIPSSHGHAITRPPSFFFFLLSATSYVAMSSLLDVEVEGITGQLAIGTYMSVEPSLNACSDSVATLATATLEPGRLSLPDSNSLRKSRQ